VVISRGAPGRGAWLCQSATPGLPKPECLAAARHRGAFSKALRAPVADSELEVLPMASTKGARIWGRGFLPGAQRGPKEGTSKQLG